MKESKKRRRKQPSKLMVSFTAGQFARCLALNELPGKSALQAATILVAMASGKNFGNQNSGESRHLATNAGLK